jgi:hypothetical protein
MLSLAQMYLWAVSINLCHAEYVNLWHGTYTCRMNADVFLKILRTLKMLNFKTSALVHLKVLVDPMAIQWRVINIFRSRWTKNVALTRLRACYTSVSVLSCNTLAHIVKEYLVREWCFRTWVRMLSLFWNSSYTYFKFQKNWNEKFTRTSSRARRLQSRFIKNRFIMWRV